MKRNRQFNSLVNSQKIKVEGIKTSRCSCFVIIFLLNFSYLLAQEQYPSEGDGKSRVLLDSIGVLSRRLLSTRASLETQDKKLKHLESELAKQKSETELCLIEKLKSADALVTSKGDLDKLKINLSNLEIKLAASEKRSADLHVDKNKLEQEIALLKDDTEANKKKLEVEALKLVKEQEAKNKALKEATSQKKENENKARQISALILQKTEIEREKAMLDSTIKEMKSIKTGLDNQIKTLREENNKLGWYGNFYRYLIIGVIVLLLIIAIYPIGSLFVGFKFSDDEARILEHERNQFIRDAFKEYFYLKKSIKILRKSIFFIVIVTVFFIFVLITLNLTDKDFTIQRLIGENFWQMIGGLTIPLGFVITLYSNAESKRTEISKFIIETMVGTQNSK